MAVQPEARPQTIAEFRKLLSIGTFISQAPGMSGASDKTNRRSSKVDSDSDEMPAKRRQDPTQKMPLEKSLASDSANSNGLKTAVLPESSPKPEVVSDKESIAWNTVNNNQNATLDQLSSFIKEYPTGPHTQQATLRLAELKSKTPTVNASTSAETASTIDTVPTTTEPSTFSVKLAVKPWGTIFVDGKQKGVTPPLKKISVTEGKHKIRIVNPNFPDYVSEIDVSKKKMLGIEHDFSAPPKTNTPQSTR